MTEKELYELRAKISELVQEQCKKHQSKCKKCTFNDYKTIGGKMCLEYCVAEHFNNHLMELINEKKEDKE